MVSSSWPTPRCDKVSHCSGISTSVAADSAAHREQAERRRAVQQDPVVRRAHRLQCGAQCVLAAGPHAAAPTRRWPARSSPGPDPGPPRSLTRTSPGTALPSSTWCIEVSRSSGSKPSENVRQACGSRSTSSTRWPRSASAAPSEATVVVLATPPFWFVTATVRGIAVIVPQRPRPGATTRPVHHRTATVVLVSTPRTLALPETVETHHAAAPAAVTSPRCARSPTSARPLGTVLLVPGLDRQQGGLRPAAGRARGVRLARVRGRPARPVRDRRPDDPRRTRCPSWAPTWWR